ncbi:zinc-binding dehydrogenase [Streptomyces yaizuensis]|uniref:Zinc-binding dehydrogenase n=1 Tax=Streptomyces yaizuensis TaxID=2989713 RepID=A0ABQ5P3Q1_9ACTN|nr:zinc-binding dehydrogenase [Streptomyces sp. YSPA8]GLF97115.1 zinc-binding dehydrogenase [Streptomyces sp. YSPA8]
MHAIRLHAYGPAENLRYEEVPDPVAGPGEVRISVAAAGVHVLDTALREGGTGPYPEPVPLPTVPGREVAGTVDAVGAGTDPSWLGKRVVAHLGMAPGGYAERAVTTAERLHELPDGLGADEAVAMIGTGRTALGILGYAEPGPDGIVIVTAAAGGLGTLITQYAKHAGATVVGLAGGPAKVAHVRANGAGLAVDYRQDDWAAQVRDFLGGRGATTVFDAVGGDTARAAVDLLGQGGHHVVYGWAGERLHDGEPLTYTEEEQAARGVTSEMILGPRMMERGGGLRALEERALREAAGGPLRPAVQRFPLAQAAASHRALENRGTIGKVVLVP